MACRSLSLAFLVVLAGCSAHRSHHHAHDGSQRTVPSAPLPPPPTHVVIRIDQVRVAPNRPNGTPWDEPQAAAVKSNADCEFLSAVAGFGIGMAYGPGAGGVAAKGMNYLCVDTSPAPQVQKDPRLPDLQVSLSAGAEPAFLSERADDAFQHVFRYELLVPYAAIPSDGLKFEVIDVDVGTAESIGFVRVSRDDVYRTLNSPTQLFTKANVDGIEKIELVMKPYAAHSEGSLAMNASEGARNTQAVVLAGEVVEAYAAGQYKVGSWYDANLTPVGYPGGGPKEYNFGVPPLNAAPHGCGFLAVGDRRRGAATVAPRGLLLSSTSGPLIVGINDNDPGNNSGSIAFNYRFRAPTVEEWMNRRAVP